MFYFYREDSIYKHVNLVNPLLRVDYAYEISFGCTKIVWELFTESSFIRGVVHMCVHVCLYRETCDGDEAGHEILDIFLAKVDAFSLK